jgi:hypothetical protein
MPRNPEISVQMQNLIASSESRASKFPAAVALNNIISHVMDEV